MKYLSMITTTNAATAGAPPPALMDAIGQLAMEAGPVMLESGGMAKTGLGRVRGGTLKIDGPYAETKEIVAGYAIYQLDSEAEALEWTRKFLELHRIHWPEWEGECQVLEIMAFG